MKTPEEIKTGLEYCSQNDPYPCNGCPYERDELLENAWRCNLNADALAYIQQLEAAHRTEYCEEADYDCIELGKARKRIAELENQLANAGKMATMKEVAESLKRMGIDCCYGEE